MAEIKTYGPMEENRHNTCETGQHRKKRVNLTQLEVRRS
jgi:hypothetical protein